jgi:hypothetical protein
MNARHGSLVGAALLISLAACSSAPATSSSSSPAATTSSEPSPTPEFQDVIALPDFAPLDPGGYFIDPDRDPSTPLRVTFEVPSAGWAQWIGALKSNDATGLDAVAITTVTNLVRDGCVDQSYAEPPVGPTVDDLTAGLAALAPFRVTSPPDDVTVDGYSGKHLGLIVPDLPIDHEGFRGCIGGHLNSWVDGIYGDTFDGYTDPGSREEFWILDVEGTRLVIAAERSPRLPSEDLAEQQAILDSIQIEPAGLQAT